MGGGVCLGFLFLGDLCVLMVVKWSCDPTLADLEANCGVAEGLLVGLKADCWDAKDILGLLAGGGMEGLGIFLAGLPVLLRAAL